MNTPEQVHAKSSGLPIAAPVHTSAPELPGLIGTEIGKYRIVRKLGEGGMGSVFEAVHSQIGQRAAIKILHAHLCHEPKFVRRFVDEARMLSMVGHAGLVKIYDFTKTSDGSQCIIMEFLEGESLWSRFCKTKGDGAKKGMPAREVTQLVRQVAATLAAVHARGITHRDLKPDNIMIVKDLESPSGERAKILDFGIAKLDEQNGTGARHTTTGVSLGTPTYMAPEQIEGLLAPTDRIDVYALGVILFELLSGEPPFQSESTGAILRQHLIKEPPALPPHVPAELQALTCAALSKEPAERPSMAQIVERLDAMGDLSRASNTALPRHTTGAAQSVSRRKLQIALTVVLLLVAAVALVTFTRRKPSLPALPPPPSQKVVPTKAVSAPDVEVPVPASNPPVAPAPVRVPETQVVKKTPPRGEIRSRPVTKGLRFGDLPKAHKRSP